MSQVTGDDTDEQLFGSPFADTLAGAGGGDTLIGGDGDDWLFGHLTSSGEDPSGLDGADSLLGGAGNDLMRGNAGNDTLLGGIGNDNLRGDAGDDLLDGGDGSDLVSYRFDELALAAGVSFSLSGAGGPGTTTVSDGRGGTDTLVDVERFLIIGSAFGDTLIGSAGDDQIQDGIAGAGNDDDSLVGGAGNDWFTPLGGDDTIVGGSGTDTLGLDYGFEQFPGPVTLSLAGLDLQGPGTVIAIGGPFGTLTVGGIERLDVGLTAAGDAFTGANSHDWLRGGAGNDTLGGVVGDDTLDGGTGNDSLAGGAGNDRFIASDGSDSVNGGVGTDTLACDFGAQNTTPVELALATLDIRIAGTTLELGAPFGSVTLTAMERLELALTAGGDLVFGSLAADLIDGRDGWDDLRGGGGADTLLGGAGNDRLYGGLFAQSVSDGTGDGADSLDGGSGNDTLSGHLGDDTLLGGEGDDLLGGETGNDRIDGGAGSDRVRYFFDDPELSAGVLFDASAAGGPGTTTVADGLGGIDTLIDVEGFQLTGSRFGDTLIGGSGDDRFFGNLTSGLDDNDSIVGGAGNDWFVASAGNDTLRGGIGIDTLEVNHRGVNGLPLDLSFAGFGSAAPIVLGGGLGSVVLSGVERLDITLSARADRCIGSAADDTIRGHRGADTLIGGAGDDSLAGSLSNTFEMDLNELDGGLGDDTLDGNWGRSLAVYETAPDAVEVDLAAGTASDGLGGTDTLILVSGAVGSAFDDTLTGSERADQFSGGGGNDRIDGGAGADTVRYDRAPGPAAGISVDLAAQRASGAGHGIDTLIGIEHAIGSSRNDRLSGDAQANQLEGLDGADRLAGASGADTLIGGAGDDTLTGGAGDDQLSGDDSQGLALGYDLVSYASATQAVNVDLATGTAGGAHGSDTLTSIEGVIGGSGNDSLVGNGVGNRLQGQAGADLLDGRAGNDTLVGGTGNDTYVVDTAGDVIEEAGTDSGEIDTVRSAVDWTLGAHLERLVLTGSARIDGSGNALANTLTGNNVNNVLDGGAGNDTLIGGFGFDTYVVDSAGDVIVEIAPFSGDIDTVRAGVNWTLGAELERLVLTGTAANGIGNTLANTLTGNASANRLTGLAGNDTLRGGAGNDTLNGGLGDDSLLGGSGADTFVFNTAPDPNTNIDRLADFAAVDDRLQLDDAVFAGIGPVGQLAAADFRLGAAAGDASDRVIYDAAAGQLFFDADGSGAAAQVLFATVAAGSTLTAADIFIV
ncbi:beta strand repeat-containing protein [Piscinibacter defluvii]|uniref:beta strand repeat-containing protein n=1 Tax=Piscinibacter defluvii TaxID=1796922 RepID=UPI0013E36882|nr:calcium-binding protein [Piscinibacter defluvii]